MTRLIIISILFFIPFIALAQFEGEMKINIYTHSISETAEMTWLIKDNNTFIKAKSKIEKISSSYQMIIKNNEETLYLLSQSNNKKTAHPISKSMMQKKQIDAPINSILIKETEESINGWNCIKYKITSPTCIINCWVTEDTGVMPSDYSSILIEKDPIMILLQFNNIKGIPVKYEVKDFSEVLLNSLEVKSITAKSIPDSQFEVPSDYTKNGTSK